MRTIHVKSPVLPVLLLCLVSILLVFSTGCVHHHHRKDNDAEPTRMSLIMAKTAPYQDWGTTRDHMRRDCDIESGIPAKIRKYAGKNYDYVFLYDTVPPDPFASILTVTIKDAKGLDGGLVSGVKYIIVEGTLKQGDRVLGTFVDRRASAIGNVTWRTFSHGPKTHTGTCTLLFQCAEAIGRDVADWLSKPTMNARLGDAERDEQ